MQPPLLIAAGRQRLVLPSADVTLIEDFLAPIAASAMASALLRELAWQGEAIQIYGRSVQVPRLVCWYGEADAHYRYSGVDHAPRPWTGRLERLRERIEAACGGRFNSVLANRYRDGSDAMGWHSDDEPELGHHPLIASLSLGAVRSMRFRHRRREHPAVGLDLASGSLLIMRGSTQSNWQHCITRTARPVAERVNLTFRYIHHTSGTSKNGGDTVN